MTVKVIKKIYPTPLYQARIPKVHLKLVDTIQIHWPTHFFSPDRSTKSSNEISK